MTPAAPPPRRDQPGPLSRRGPRPLLLHLMLAQHRNWTRMTGMNFGASTPASPSWNAGWPDLAALLASASATNLPEPPADVFAADRAMIAGIAAYRRHPDRRTLPDPPALWSEGEARLLDYGTTTPGAPAVLFVPSLVNRAYILDLAPRHSLLAHLAGAGLRPLLLDWGWPGEAERRYTLTDYVAGVLERAIVAVGTPVVLAGYCMGGLLALAGALRRPDLVRGLALLATPWDFHAHDAAQAAALARTVPMFAPLLHASGTLPIDAMQTLFALLDPPAVAHKFQRFGRLDQQGAAAKLFVALEDWVNDGVPLAAPVARACFEEWYGANAPMRGQWRIAGQAIDPHALRLPAFVAVPGQDRIVPPASARPLAAALAGATVIEPAAGHVSMVAGTKAEALLWRPLTSWLQALA